MREIKVTKENHARLDSVTDTWKFGWKETYNSMMDLNAMLNEELGGMSDWGGKYSSWLDSFGIESNTDNGWWSLAAIDQENLSSFIEYEKDEEEGGWHDKCAYVLRMIMQVNKAGKFKARTKSVVRLVNDLSDGWGKEQ